MWLFVRACNSVAIQDGQVLIFVNQKSGASELAVAIREFMSLPCEALHGDSDQNDRMKVANLVWAVENKRDDFLSGNYTVYHAHRELGI